MKLRRLAVQLAWSLIAALALGGLLVRAVDAALGEAAAGRSALGSCAGCTAQTP